MSIFSFLYRGLNTAGSSALGSLPGGLRAANLACLECCLGAIHCSLLRLLFTPFTSSFQVLKLMIKLCVSMGNAFCIHSNPLVGRFRSLRIGGRTLGGSRLDILRARLLPWAKKSELDKAQRNMDEHPLAGPVNPRAPIGRRDSVGSEDQDAPRRPSADVEKAMVLVKDTILALFPDICPEYLQTLAACRNYDCNDIVLDILDNHGEEGSYPRRQEPNLKRKRADEIDDDAEAEMRKFDNPDRRRERKSQNYIVRAIALLMCAFPRAYQKDVAGILMENDNCLFPAFMAMHDRESGKGPGAPLSRKVRATRMEPGLKENEIDATIRSLPQGEEKTIIEEFRAARRAAHELTVKWNEEETNINRAKAEGTITECGCCFDEQPMNRMVHCDSQEKHWFCCACAKQMAETQVGLSKYELNCMSMDGCAGGFSHSQRDVFLDAKLTLALDLLEQEANVRMAGIENLETCPSCPFAAECPPIEIDKEFRCMNPECGIVICRMCRRKTHLPKTCMEAEAAGDSARHTIEEAMSAALIRKCNKCTYTYKTSPLPPFVLLPLSPSGLFMLYTCEY